jgi:hypothetical protein
VQLQHGIIIQVTNILNYIQPVPVLVAVQIKHIIYIKAEIKNHTELLLAGQPILTDQLPTIAVIRLHIMILTAIKILGVIYI